MKRQPKGKAATKRKPEPKRRVAARKEATPAKASPAPAAQRPAEKEAVPSAAGRLVEQFRAVAVEAVERHDKATAHRTRFDALQSLNKADRFLLTALRCYLSDGELETLDAAAPWDGLFSRYTNRGKKVHAAAE